MLRFSNYSLSTVALSFVIPSEAEGSAVPRTFPGNAEYDAQEHCHLACSAPNDLGSGAGVLAQNIGVFVKRLVISRLPSSLLEMRILFEHRIPRFQERCAGVSSGNWFEGSQVSKARPGAPFDFTLRYCREHMLCHFSPDSQTASRLLGMTKERETVHKE
jgi:hypothetical protein